MSFLLISVLALPTTAAVACDCSKFPEVSAECFPQCSELLATGSNSIKDAPADVANAISALKEAAKQGKKINYDAITSKAELIKQANQLSSDTKHPGVE